MSTGDATEGALNGDATEGATEGALNGDATEGALNGAIWAVYFYLDVYGSSKCQKWHRLVCCRCQLVMQLKEH